MRPSLELRPVREMGLLKAVATLEDPVVRLENWEADMPVVTIAEGGVELELEFVSVETLRSFQRQVALLAPEEERHA